MNSKKEEIRELAQEILDQNKEDYSVSEWAILVQSQYFNIEELYIYGSNLKSKNLDEHIEIDNRILSICEGYLSNLEPLKYIGWEDKESQKNRVKHIQADVQKAKELHLAMKEYQRFPNPDSEFKMLELVNGKDDPFNLRKSKDKLFLEAINKELKNHIIARFKKNNDRISPVEMENEAAFTVAVNVLISQNQIDHIPQSTLKFLFEGVNETLKELFPNDYGVENFQHIRNIYQFLMQKNDVKDLVNQHFNELYSTNKYYVV